MCLVVVSLSLIQRESLIKAKCFEMFPCHVTENIAAKWGNCVTAIDERSRRLKNKPNKKKLPLTCHLNSDLKVIRCYCFVYDLGKLI